MIPSNLEPMIASNNHGVEDANKKLCLPECKCMGTAVSSSLIAQAVSALNEVEVALDATSKIIKLQLEDAEDSTICERINQNCHGTNAKPSGLEMMDGIPMKPKPVTLPRKCKSLGDKAHKKKLAAESEKRRHLDHSGRARREGGNVAEKPANKRERRFRKAVSRSKTHDGSSEKLTEMRRSAREVSSPRRASKSVVRSSGRRSSLREAVRRARSHDGTLPSLKTINSDKHTSKKERSSSFTARATAKSKREQASSQQKQDAIHAVSAEDILQATSKNQTRSKEVLPQTIHPSTPEKSTRKKKRSSSLARAMAKSHQQQSSSGHKDAKHAVSAEDILQSTPKNQKSKETLVETIRPTIPEKSIRKKERSSSLARAMAKSHQQQASSGHNQDANHAVSAEGILQATSKNQRSKDALLEILASKEPGDALTKSQRKTRQQVKSRSKQSSKQRSSSTSRARSNPGSSRRCRSETDRKASSSKTSQSKSISPKPSAGDRRGKASVSSHRRSDVRSVAFKVAKRRSSFDESYFRGLTADMCKPESVLSHRRVSVPTSPTESSRHSKTSMSRSEKERGDSASPTKESSDGLDRCERSHSARGVSLPDEVPHKYRRGSSRLHRSLDLSFSTATASRRSTRGRRTTPSCSVRGCQILQALNQEATDLLEESSGVDDLSIHEASCPNEEKSISKLEYLEQRSKFSMRGSRTALASLSNHDSSSLHDSIEGPSLGLDRVERPRLNATDLHASYSQSCTRLSKSMSVLVVSPMVLSSKPGVSKATLRGSMSRIDGMTTATAAECKPSMATLPEKMEH